MTTKPTVSGSVKAARMIGVGVFCLTLCVAASRQGRASCPPPDFPRYDGSQQTAPASNAGSAYECDAEFTAPAEVSTVTAYMRAQLDSGDWTLVTADSRQGVLAFKRQSDSTISGQVEVLARGDRSLVEVQIVNR